MSWWNPALNALADQLSQGVLNEMKKRILCSNIKKEKLQLDESSERMRDFFKREIERHNKRKQTLKQKSQKVQEIVKELQRVQQRLQQVQTQLNQRETEFKKRFSLSIYRTR